MTKRISQDLEVASVSVRDPFMVQCAGHNYRHKPNRYMSTPVDLPDPFRIPEDPDQCCHVWEEENEGQMCVRRCTNRIYLGIHGWLCKDHHEDSIFRLRGSTPRKSELDLADILPVLQSEVDNTAPSSIGVDYKNYSQWGWSRLEETGEGYNQD